MRDDGRNFIPHGRIGLGVLGFLDDAHTALTEFLQNFVM
jgi:hypothetical protein